MISKALQVSSETQPKWHRCLCT